MDSRKLLAIISRDFLKSKNVYRYRMKKIDDMDDDEVIRVCHWYYEENRLHQEWEEFRAKAESEYRFCSYLKEDIEAGLCYDIQMIAGDYIKSSALPEIKIDKEKCLECCAECQYSM